ncbi:Uu.00g033480.m01.CDS01 [Anthostomella pinea]|uniref:Uu.00g033480.m01.CDS01 n=1 Tax=Anthostomella pinea TaxID=933095 RepID=A0AAI8V8W2_9PEZI|nr:Uu.00g033480.m01.CDS01 [Anthostomella pinea]
MSISRRSRDHRTSKYLPPELENELKVHVFIQEALASSYLSGPQLIIGNVDSGCHAVFHENEDGTRFYFHHARMVYGTGCRCIAKGERGDISEQIPAELDSHRIQLILGEGPSGHRMEPKFSAMVVMKIFLGMDVPEELRMEDGLCRKMIRRLANDTGENKKAKPGPISLVLETIEE